MSAKETTVNIRVDAATKARWQKAAGGPRKLSAWLTELANAASSPDAAEVLTALGAQAKIAQAALPLVTPVIPVTPPAIKEVATPRIAASGDEGEPGGDLSGETSDASGSAHAGPPAPVFDTRDTTPKQCPRWPHHREGVYCGTCRKVN